MFYGCTIIYLLNPLLMDIDWSQPFRFYSEAMNILCAHVPVYLRDITSGAISGHKLFPILKSGDLILMLSPKKQVYLFFATPPLQRLRGSCHPSHISFQVFKYSQFSKLPPAACPLPEWSPSQLLRETEAQADARHKSSSGLAVPLSPSISSPLPRGQVPGCQTAPPPPWVLHRLRPLATPIRSPSSVRSGAAERHANLPSPL